MSTVDWMTSPKIAVFSRSLGKEFCPPNSYCQIRQRRTMTNKLQPQRLYLHCEQFAWIHVWNALRWKLNLTIGIIIKFDFCCRFGRDWIPNMNLNSKMSAEIIKSQGCACQWACITEHIPRQNRISVNGDFWLSANGRLCLKILVG